MKPIYSCIEHEVLIEDYMTSVLNGVLPLVNDNDRKIEYTEILNAIIEYHNEYGDQYDSGNYYDFLTIIPLQLSIMSSGFLCGISNQDNTLQIQIQKQLIYTKTIQVVENLHKLKTKYE